MNDIVQQSAKPQIIVSASRSGASDHAGYGCAEPSPAGCRRIARGDGACAGHIRRRAAVECCPNGINSDFPVGGRRDAARYLVFPGQADISKGKISILTPVGAALIGLSEGQSITWSTRDGTSSPPHRRGGRETAQHKSRVSDHGHEPLDDHHHPNLRRRRGGCRVCDRR